jgi:hypothetical protein
VRERRMDNELLEEMEEALEAGVGTFHRVIQFRTRVMGWHFSPRYSVQNSGYGLWVALFTLFRPELGLWVGTFHVILHSKHIQFNRPQPVYTVHVTNLTPGSESNPTRRLSRLLADETPKCGVC